MLAVDVRMDEEYTLYVDNPSRVELTEGFIRDIFGQYGRILRFYHPANKTYCFVTYQSYCEAERAMRELHNVKPLNLKVQPAEKQNLFGKRQRPVIKNNLEQSKMINAADLQPAIHQGNVEQQDTGHSSQKCVPQIVPSVDQGLSMPSCSCTANISDIAEHISRLWEQRNKGLYEYSEDDFRTAVQNCSICDTKTTKRCENCDWKYYCSRACQIKDWPQHQAECGSIPALDVIDNTLLIKQDVNKRPSTPNVDTGEFSGEVKRRRIDTFNVWQEEANNTTRNGINKESNIKITHSFITQDNYYDAHDNYAPEIKKENQAVIKKEKINDSSYKDTYFISNIEFTTVQVIKSLGNDQYWVFKLEDTYARTNLLTKLQGMKNSPNVLPVIGEVYGLKYEDLWYRAMVTSLNPTVVHFIDFDIDETLIKDAELKDLGELKSPITTKIRLPQGISDKYRNLQRGDKISVRMLSVDSEKTIIVEIKEVQPVATDTTSHATESASSNATKKFVSQENAEASTSKNYIGYRAVKDIKINVAPLGRVNDTVNALLLFKKRDDELIFAPFDTNLSKVLDMSAKLKEYCEKTDHIPKDHELCLALFEGEWRRGRCLNTTKSNTSEIFFIDCGKTEPVKHQDLRLMPEDFIEPAALANTCTIINLGPETNGEYSLVVKKKLQMLTVGKLISIKILNCLKDGVYEIELPDVSAALLKQLKPLVSKYLI